MIAQTLFPFKIETTREKLTAHGGLALERFLNSASRGMAKKESEKINNGQM
jgi:hypothetical protein